MNRKVMYPICCVLGFLAFLVFPAINYAGPNSSAGCALDLDYTTHDYDPGITSKDIDSSIGAEANDEIWVAVVAQNVTNLDTYQVEVVFDANHMDFIEGYEDNPFAGINNLLKRNGGSTIGFQAAENVAGTVTIANALVGTNTDEAPEGSGIIALLKFEVLDGDYHNELTLSNVNYLDSGAINDPITNLMDAVVNPSTTCLDNSDCGPDFYCKKPEGDCDGEGVCTPRPGHCPIILGGQVCGCDGQTYPSGCDAAQAGVSVAYGGYCNADVAVTKIGEPNPLFVGNGHDNILMYTLTVTNAGPEDAGGVTLTDDVPLDNPEFSTDGGSSWHTWVGSENLGTILAGGSQDVLIKGTVGQPDTAGVFSISNTASVSSDRFDYELSNNTVTVFNTIITDDTPVAPFPLLEDYESGDLANYWTTNSTGAGRIKVTTAYDPYGGKYHLTMDSAWWRTPSLNELVLTVDLSGHAGVMLSFWHKEFNDEDNVMPDSFIGSHNSDGVAISADGTTWHKVQGLTGADGINSGWHGYEVDLDAVAVAAGISYNGAFKIKFQQYGKDPIVSTTFPFSDGFAFDDMEVYQGIVDTDGDGMPDEWEVQYGLDPEDSSDADQDPDDDELDNLSEYQHDTNPNNQDSDYDEMPDGWEVQYRLNPLDASDAYGDLDDDGLTNLQEYEANRDPWVAEAGFPFLEDFETGELDTCWTANSIGAGRIKVTTAHGPYGGRYHLTMDSATWRTPSLNELVLTIDLSGETGVMLSFWHKEFNDEDHVMPDFFFGSHNSDGVAISVDGTTWYRVQGLTGADGISSGWQGYEVDLDAAAVAAGISYNGAFKIKFQQYGKDPIVSSTFPFSDGFAFEDIEVY
jgi:hypothetical protein